MNLKIGELSKLTGVAAKTIRYYEEAGLVGAAKRLPNGYRIYSQQDAHMLAFVKRARGLGFSVHETSQLLTLWKNKRRKSEHVQRLAHAHLEEIDRKIVELEEMKGTLKELVGHCQGDERPDCPIIDSLAGLTS